MKSHQKRALLNSLLIKMAWLCSITLTNSVPVLATRNTLPRPGKTYVIENGKIQLVINCGNQASVVSMALNGRQVINAPDGMYTALNYNGKTFTSLHLLRKPAAVPGKDGIVINNIIYGDDELSVAECWTFLRKGDEIVWQIARKFSKKVALTANSAPVINFKSIKTWDGAFQGYGGLAWFYLFTDKPSSYGVHSQTSRFWNSRNADGLDVSVSSPGNKVAMTYKYTADNRLEYTIVVSPQAIIPRLDKDTHRRLFIRGDGNVWEPVPGVNNSTQSVIFKYANNTKRYDRGHLTGVNGKQISAVLNTIARIGVIDSLHYGGNSWATPYGPICLHEQYIAQLGLGINDPAYLKGYKACLDFYRDHAIKADGRVYSRWAYSNEDAAPGQYNKYGFYEAQWGTLMDSNPDYVSNVADLFDLTGNNNWVKGQQQACEKALDWILNRDKNHNGLVEMMNDNQDEQKSSDWIDIVWASYENAFVNAKLYYALSKWAKIEKLLGNITKAEYYKNFAAKLKESFNKPCSQGGLWDEENNCYVHWRDKSGAIHGRNMVTPVNFMAIAYGICDQQERQQQILDGIEEQMQKEKLFFWPLTLTSYEPGELRKDQLPFPNYENGDLFLSWGAVGVAAYAKYKPQIALKYVKNVLQQYGNDGLAFQRYSRKDQHGQGDDILAGNSLAIVGLYQSIYGVNPLYNRLYLDPHLTPELAGTMLKYHYQDQLLNIRLSPGDYIIADGRVELRAAEKFGFYATGNLLSYFDKGDENPAMQITGSTRYRLTINLWTGQQKTFTINSLNGKAQRVTFRIRALKPLTMYSLRVGGKISSTKSNSKGDIVFTDNTSAGGRKISITAF
ncbi:alpha-L-rhamnosidase-related protein [Mucilaginibacter lutimaris]